MTRNAPRPPAGTGKAGTDLWRDVLTSYDLEEHELSLLRQATRTLDHLAALDALVAAEGVVIESPQGRKPHPAMVEGRQQRVVLARLLGALRLPAGEEGEADRRPQRRIGVRGPYALGSAS